MLKHLPIEIDNCKNEKVLRYLDSLSCHSDIIQPISKCLEQYEDVSTYTSNPDTFGYVLWFVNGTVFAFAAGMQEVCLRLGDVQASGGRNHENLEGWIRFPYDSCELCVAVGHAYNYAR